jgi:hypothetical protein
VPHGCCSWSVRVGSSGGVVVVPLWGVASWAFVVLRIAVDMARPDEPLVCHVSGLVVVRFVGHHHRCGCGRCGGGCQRRWRLRCVGGQWGWWVIVVCGGGGKRKGWHGWSHQIKCWGLPTSFLGKRSAGWYV